MKILGIETSCDETSAAIIQAMPGDQSVMLLSNVISSSLSLHAKTGGIIPEIAARQQIKYIIPVIEQALNEAGIRHSGLSRIDSGVGRLRQPPQNDRPAIDAIAVTIGPGLIGSLLVGVETAKTLSYVWNKPIIPVNHLIGHIYANFVSENTKYEIRNTNIEFPVLALIVSGGHTDLVLMKAHQKLKWLGGTRDDAAGEAFDKIGRLLGLPYPGGPAIEQAAKHGDPKAFRFPRPLIGSDDFDFSFSGLKTAVFREVTKLYSSSEEVTTSREVKPSDSSRSRLSGTSNNKKLPYKIISDLCASVQQAIIDVLVKKTLRAAQKYEVKSILLSGGVAANQKLRNVMESSINNHQSAIKLFAPPKNLCTDNGAMIASAAFFNYKEVPWQKLTADPELYF